MGNTHTARGGPHCVSSRLSQSPSLMDSDERKKLNWHLNVENQLFWSWKHMFRHLFYHNRITGSRVTAILLNRWIFPIGGTSAVEGLLSTGYPV